MNLADILGGAVPPQTKEDVRIAAKRQRDRKRYAEKTQLNWKPEVEPPTTEDPMV